MKRAKYTPIVTDERIVQALEDAFKIPVVYARMNDENLDSYFFYFREKADRVKNEQYISERLVIGYVSVNAPNDLTYEIADVLEEIGLIINGIDFDVIQLTDGKNYADVSLFQVIRRIRKEPGRIQMIKAGD